MKALRSGAVWISGLLDRWQWVPLVAASPALLFPSRANVLLVLILPAGWAVSLLAKRGAFPRTPLNVALLLLTLMVLVSEWATYDLVLSASKVTGVVLGIGAFAAIVRAGGEARGWWLSLLAGLGLGTAFAAFGVIGTRWGTKIASLNALFQGQAMRIRGIPGIEEGLNPNQLAGSLLWVLPVLLILCGIVVTDRLALPQDWGRWLRLAVRTAAVAVTGFVLVTFLLTESRSAYAGFLVAMLLVVLALSPRPRVKVLLALLAAGIAGVGSFLVWRGGSDFLVAMIQGAPQSSIYSLSTLQARLDMWSSAVQAIQDFPLTGTGMNTFRTLAGSLYPLVPGAVDYDIAHAHNELLQAGLDLGIPGMVAFLALHLSALRMVLAIDAPSRGTAVTPDRPGGEPMTSLELARSWEGASPWAQPLNRSRRRLAVGLGAGLLAHAIYGLTDAVALGAKPGILFWMLLALIVCLYTRGNSESSSEAAAEVATRDMERNAA